MHSQTQRMFQKWIGQHASTTMANAVLKMKRTVSVKYNTLELSLGVSSWEEEPAGGVRVLRRFGSQTTGITFALTAFLFHRAA